MPISPGFDLAEGDRAMVAEGLLQLLADALLLAIQTREAAWHLQGAPLLHLQAELLSQSDELLRGLDPVALRVRVLGFRPAEGLSAGLAKRLAGAEAADAITPGALIRALATRHDDLAGSLRFLRPVLRDLDDGATALLVDKRLARHESSADRLRSLAATSPEQERRYERLLSAGGEETWPDRGRPGAGPAGAD